MIRKIYCYSRSEFENICTESGWNSNNIPSDKAFISICSTADVKSAILKDPEPHYFKDGLDQALNVDFDDIATPFEFLDEDGLNMAIGISLPQAIKIVRFIDKHIGSKDILVHCRAGQSRSQALVRYIMWMYGRLYEIETRKDNPPITPNPFVLHTLKKAANLLHLDLKIDFTSEGYSVKGITETTVNGLVTSIKVYLENLPELLYDPEECVWSWEFDGGQYCYDDWDFKTEFEKFVKNREGLNSL